MPGWRYDPLLWWNFQKACFYACVALLLSGCTADVVKPVTTACPSLKTYDQTFQSAFADELTLMHASGDYPHVEAFVVDSVKLRQVLKTCQN